MAEDKIYIVQAGDCLSSIAHREGFFWKALWDHNPKIKAKRKNPNVLQPGDEILIPERNIKEYSRATEKRHRFLKKGTPAKFRLVLERDDEPIKNKRYVLTVDGKLFSGTTDDRGFLEVAIDPSASRGTLEIEDLLYDLEFGGLDPHEEATGVQDRLRNLGFYHGALDGIVGPLTRDAIADFQSSLGLPVTGELDDSTREKLFSRQDKLHEPLAKPAAAEAEESPESEATPEPAEASGDSGAEPVDSEDLDSEEQDIEIEIPEDTSDR